MNILIHFLLNYFIIDAVFGNARELIWIILIFSSLIDLDHLPYLFKVSRKVLFKKGFTMESKTKYHELYGLFILSLACSFLYFFSPYKLIIKVAMICLVLHYVLDFLINHTMPLQPYSKAIVFFGVCPNKYRLQTEIISTIILGGLFWLYLLG